MREKYGQSVKGHDMQALGMIKHKNVALCECLDT